MRQLLEPKSDKDRQCLETRRHALAVLFEILWEDDPLAVWTTDP